MRILISGINGFAASHLCDYILQEHEEVEIHGTIRRRSNLENIDHIKDKLHLHECDLRDSHSVDRVVEEVMADRIFHLAAQSFVPTSWKIPTETFETNVIGTLNLLEAVRRQPDYDPIIQIAGSSEEYGAVKLKDLPINEDCPLRPLSPYGVSKVTQDLLGYQYYKSYGMKIVRTRAFNHSGIRRPADFVDSCFAKQVALVEKGKQKVIYHGNLEAIRDFTDVRDVVRAYWLVTDSCLLVGKAVNIGSGLSCWTIQAVLDELIKFSGKEIKTELDPARNRPSDVPVLICDSELLFKKTGWFSGYDYKDTLLDMLNYWRERV